MTMSSEKRCRPIESEHLFPNSWACCSCATLNSGYAMGIDDQCWNCGHDRCYYPEITIESTAKVEEVDLNWEVGEVQSGQKSN
jgi:hypothetical protein